MIASSRTVDSGCVADHYNELDSFYREIWGEHVHHGLWLTGKEDPALAVLQLVRLVAEKARIAPGDRVCDIGCGYGAAARLIAREFGAQVTAITVSGAQYSYACQIDHSGNPNYLLSDWFAAQLPPETFDSSFAIESSEHMADKVKFFSRTLDILKAGGRMVVCSWLAADAPGRWQRRWLLEPICQEGRIPHLFNAVELIAAAEEAGFKLIDQTDLSDQVCRTWSIVITRFAKRLISDLRYWSFLFDSDYKNKVFAITVIRIWLAYRTRGMQYGIFTFAK